MILNKKKDVIKPEKNNGVEYMIDIKDLTISYTKDNITHEVFHGFNLNIKSGEICAIIGMSGAGKSTLVRTLAGINKSYSGEVLIKGETVNPEIHSIGFVPQNYGLIDWKTAKQNILLASILKFGKKNVDMEFYEELLEELKIKDLEDRYPKELSGGEAQRVAVARALLLKPDLLLMDEPFSSLDIITREFVQEIFLKVWREHKVTTVLVTHDINEAMYLGHKIMVLDSMKNSININNENNVPMENSFFGNKDKYTNEKNDYYMKLRDMIRGGEYD